MGIGMVSAYHWGAIGHRESMAAQRLEVQDCEEVRSMAPRGMLHFEGGELSIPSETHCEVLTVRDDVGRFSGECSSSGLGDSTTASLSLSSHIL